MFVFAEECKRGASLRYGAESGSTYRKVVRDPLHIHTVQTVNSIFNFLQSNCMYLEKS